MNVGGTTAEIVGREVVEEYGGMVLALDAVEAISTTSLVARIVSQADTPELAAAR